MCNKCYTPLSREEIIDVLCEAEYCRLAVAERNQPYIVPMMFLWKEESCKIYFLLLSNACGEKMNTIRRNDKVALEFEDSDVNSISTVVVKGKVIRIVDSECDCDIPEGCCAIEILTRTITGRRFDIGGIL